MQVLSIREDALFLPITGATFSLDASGASASAPFLIMRLGTVSRPVWYPLESAQPRLDQAWFWTPQWQAMEGEADEDLAAGRYQDFDTIDDLIESLDRLTAE